MAGAKERMTREQMREQMKVGILIAARVHALKRLAKDTARAYDEAVARSGLPPEHFRLRAMLLGRLPLLPPPRQDPSGPRPPHGEEVPAVIDLTCREMRAKWRHGPHQSRA